MNELIEKFSSDSTWMFVGAMAMAVLLFVVLVVVVSSMRVKGYKDRFVNVQIDNHEKSEEIAALQHELQGLKSQHARQSEALKEFAQTRENLQSTRKELGALRAAYQKLENLENQTRTKLENTEEMLAILQQEHHALKERFDLLTEENSKLRVNNARLLMKLDNEARQRD
jgi:septal ring factor EnvC (AmiA/AmiB activator)